MYLLLFSSKSHYDEMVSTEDMPLEKLFQRALRLSSIYMNPVSSDCHNN